MMDWLSLFKNVWFVDFEFCQPEGERPVVVCMVARELFTGHVLRRWRDELEAPPFDLGPESLFVAFYSSAEWGCHLALGWPMPARILDLYAEFRCVTSGLNRPNGSGLLGALSYFGLDALDAVEKDAMRQLVIRGGPWTDDEKRAILDYCQSDVDSLARLLPPMLPQIDFPRALIRGRFMAAVARMEFTGVPIDVHALARIRCQWEGIQDRLISRIDQRFHIYEGRTFKAERFGAWLAQRGIAWPRLPSGALALDDDTFKEIARSHPEISPLRELRVSLSQMRLNELAVGSDGRNRCLLSPFASRTGRNQPSNTRFIFGPSVWLRGLIRPQPGMAVAYLDYEQQEFGIGAALSGDTAMIDAYLSGDPYLAFARQAGAVPPNATKETHAAERDRFKVCALGVQYGMQAEGLAKKLDDSPARASELLRLHRATYPTYWRWSDAIRDYAVLHGKLHTVFGWAVHLGESVNPRSLRNFPLQANGAELLRLACCLATEQGIRVCCPVHDALLIEADDGDIDDAVRKCREAMEEASRIVLGGFTIRTETKIVRHPGRYMDKRGLTMWNAVSELVGSFDD
jgi:DNA polymerase family A